MKSSATCIITTKTTIVCDLFVFPQLPNLFTSSIPLPQFLKSEGKHRNDRQFEAGNLIVCHPVSSFSQIWERSQDLGFLRSSPRMDPNPRAPLLLAIVVLALGVSVVKTWPDQISDLWVQGSLNPASSLEWLMRVFCLYGQVASAEDDASGVSLGRRAGVRNPITSRSKNSVRLRTSFWCQSVNFDRWFALVVPFS